MTNSLERIFDGLIDVLHTRVIPKIADEFARGQAYGALDMLRNLKPRVGWATGPLREDVEAELALVARIAARLDGINPTLPTPPSPDLPNAANLDAAELEIMRDRLDEHLCDVLRWLSQHRGAAADAAGELETAIRDQQRIRLKREVKLTAPPLFGEISRGQ